MNPLFRILLGVAAGAALVKLTQSKESRHCVKTAGQSLRSATVSGLETIEHSSAKLRHKLAQPGVETPAKTSDTEVTGGQMDDAAQS